MHLNGWCTHEAAALVLGHGSLVLLGGLCTDGLYRSTVSTDWPLLHGSERPRALNFSHCTHADQYVYEQCSFWHLDGHAALVG